MSPDTGGIGDVLRTIAALRLGPEEWKRAALALGYTIEEIAPATSSAEFGSSTPSDGGDRGSARVLTRVVPSASPAIAEPSLPLLAPLEDVAPVSRRSFAGVAPLLLAAPADQPPGLEPLLRPRAGKAILGAAIRVRAESREPDIARIADLIARRLPVVRVPRRIRHRLPSAVIVLDDLGPAMEPFSEDVPMVVEALESLVGRGNVRAAPFIDDPAEALERHRLSPGTSIMAITELGISPLSPPDERRSARWTTLEARLRSRRVLLSVLVPHRARRWPPALTSGVAVISWDRRTTVGHVIKARTRAGA